MCFGGTLIENIEPNTIDPLTQKITSCHMAMVDNQIRSNGLLLLSIGGTNSHTTDFAAFNQAATQLGYFALAIDYPNSVITTACRLREDLGCFRAFREEVVFGNDVSDIVNVDIKNSLIYRIESTLRHLNKFVKDGNIQWDKIVLVGHSQGSGHAAYIAKHRRVHGVIMLAGPQDHNQTAAAGWLGEPGLTPADRHYAFIHESDFFESGKQISTAKKLINNPTLKPVLVKREAPKETSQIVITQEPVNDPHKSVIQDIFKEIWDYFLKEVSK